MRAIETYEVYAIRYATLARKASDNFIGSIRTKLAARSITTSGSRAARRAHLSSTPDSTRRWPSAADARCCCRRISD